MATAKNSAPGAVVDADDVIDTSLADAGNDRCNVQAVLTPPFDVAFITDCARHLEGLLSEAEVRVKWTLNDKDWAGLASNIPLLTAVRAERDRRIVNGQCPREAAQRYFAKAPHILDRILNNEAVASRHRIEAARELRQTATSGADAPIGPQEKFMIVINMGATKFEKEFARPEPCKEIAALERLPDGDGES